MQCSSYFIAFAGDKTSSARLTFDILRYPMSMLGAPVMLASDPGAWAMYDFALGPWHYRPTCARERSTVHYCTSSF